MIIFLPRLEKYQFSKPPESKESTHPLAFTSTKLTKMSDFSDKIVRIECCRISKITQSGRVTFLIQSFGRKSDNKSDFIFPNSCDGFWPTSLYWSYKIPSRDPNFNDIQPRYTLANHGIE